MQIISFSAFLLQCTPGFSGGQCNGCSGLLTGCNTLHWDIIVLGHTRNRHVIHRYCSLFFFFFKLSLSKIPAFGIEKQTALKLVLFSFSWGLFMTGENFVNMISRCSMRKKNKCTVKGSTFPVYSNRIQKFFLQHFKWENIDKHCSKEITSKQVHKNQSLHVLNVS